MEEQKSIQTSKDTVPTPERRTFRTTLDKLRSALKSQPKQKSPRSQEPIAQIKHSPELEEIEKQLKSVPEAELFKGESPQIIRETAKGIEKLGPIQVPEETRHDQTRNRDSDKEGEKYEDALDKIEEEVPNPEIKKNDNQENGNVSIPVSKQQEIQAQLEKNAEEELPSVTQRREALEQSESADSTAGESDFEIKEFEPPIQNLHTSLPTMDQERESMVEEEAKWVKEHHMEDDEPKYEPPIQDTRGGNPDILSEGSRQLRGSFTDRDEDMTNALRLNAKNQDKLEPIRGHLAEEYEKLRSEFERDLSTKEDQPGSSEQENENSFNIDTLVTYLNDNKIALEETMNEDEKKHMQSALNISKDLKSLAKEAIDALKIDLMKFYYMGKNTVTSAFS